MRHVAVVRRGLEVLVLLAREDVDRDEVALGVAVLAWGKGRRSGKGKRVSEREEVEVERKALLSRLAAAAKKGESPPFVLSLSLKRSLLSLCRKLRGNNALIQSSPQELEQRGLD